MTNKQKTGKQITLHFYKRFDSDLIAFQVQTGKLGRLVKDALYHFAREKPFVACMPELRVVDLSEYMSFRMQVYITDSESIAMLERVKPYHRTSFIKAIVRNAMFIQHVGPYLKDPAYLVHANARMAALLSQKPDGVKIYPFTDKVAVPRRPKGFEFYSKDEDTQDAERVERSFLRAKMDKTAKQEAKEAMEEFGFEDGLDVSGDDDEPLAHLQVMDSPENYPDEVPETPAADETPARRRLFSDIDAFS